MTELFDEIKKANRLTRMRMGQDAPDIVALKSRPEVRVALVPLTGKEDMQAWTAAAELDLSDNPYAIEVRDRVLKVNTLFHAIRLPDDVTTRVFPSAKQLEEELEDLDINYLSERYQLLKADSSPALEGLDEEAMSRLKRVWQTIDLNVLSGRSWELARALLLEISADSLMGRQPGPSSTSRSIGTSEKRESTRGVKKS